MEIYSTIGLSDHIYTHMPPTEDWRHFIYCNSVTGTKYKVHDHFHSGAFKLNSSLSHFIPAHYPQHKLVNLLVSTLPKSSSLHLGEEAKSVSFVQDHVKVKTNNKEYIADYVIACDGASSKIRENLGISLSSDQVLQSFVNVHFVSKQLGKICKENPAMMYFVYNAKAVVVLVMHNAEEGEFILQIPDFPPLTCASDYTIVKIKEVINASSGDDITDVSIQSIKQWKMMTRNAEKLRIGNVFLAGDAAHTLTPAGGLGLNTGIYDIHNLFWKFKFPELLDSYEEERLARIKEAIDLSYKNYYKVFKIAKNMGLNLDLVKPMTGLLECVPLGSTIFKLAKDLGQKILLDDSNAKSFLSNPENLLDLIFPKEDLMFKHKTGFFLNGGELGSNHEISYKGENRILRLLPGIISREEGKCGFIKVIGKGEMPDFDLPSLDLYLPNEKSVILRPDGLVYWMSEKA